MAPDLKQMKLIVDMYFAEMVYNNNGLSVQNRQPVRLCTLDDFAGAEDVFTEQQKIAPNSMICPSNFVSFSLLGGKRHDL
jgi:hypothetical protein